MNRKAAALVSVTFLLLAVIGAATAMALLGDVPSPEREAATPSPIPEVVDLSQIKEEAVRALFDDTGRMINPDEQLADIARNHEGGFGGFYFHQTDKSIVYVYMLDVTKTTAAEAAFRAAYHGDREIARIIPVRGDYSFDQLVEWFRILDRALIESGIPPAETSVREIENRIRIGLFDADQIDDALQVMERLGIPEGAVVLEEGGLRKLSSSGGADDPEVEHPDLVRQHPETEPAPDNITLAAETGLPLEGVDRAIAFQEAFGKYAEDLIGRFPEQISGIWIDSPPGAEGPRKRGHIRFVGQVPANLPTPENVTLTGGGEISMGDQRRRAKIAAKALSDAGYREFATFFSSEENVIHVELLLEEDAVAPMKSDIVAIVRDLVESSEDLQGRASQVVVLDITLTVLRGSGPFITLE